ncbi:MAG: hypothetical protein F6K18_15770 [Okeania sp. SIO2C2]|uniref:hypothetical protein n=1 Tax=Okeania sp. SIO2C2 TaxID=2607787 RepID=UPI0013BCB094|nr:hypothetical protein [Okeania sp. SIO2C2]NEP88170.1 hypothetical protein [Okeania sp. SIO2C2]
MKLEVKSQKLRVRIFFGNWDFEQLSKNISPQKAGFRPNYFDNIEEDRRQKEKLLMIVNDRSFRVL